MDKEEIYQELRKTTEGTKSPVMSLTKDQGGNLIARRSFGGINFPTKEIARKSLTLLMNVGWPVKVMVPGMKQPQVRKTVDSVMDNFFKK